MEDCLFCKIINGDVPSTKVYEDDKVFVFKDIAPAAPIHYLLIPKEHISSALELNSDNSAIVGYIYEIAGKIARDEGFADKGFRIVNNCGEQAGQTVFHLHFHLLAGRELAWPAG